MSATDQEDEVPLGDGAEYFLFGAEQDPQQQEDGREEAKDDEAHDEQQQILDEEDSTPEFKCAQATSTSACAVSLFR